MTKLESSRIWVCAASVVLWLSGCAPRVAVVDAVDRLPNGNVDYRLPGAAKSSLATGLAQAPVLRIENQLPTGPISGIASDARGRWIVTASVDKTARVWAADTGELSTIIRPPIGDASVGNIRGIAISPDGSTVAIGWVGQEAAAIMLFDRFTGRMKSRITGLLNVVADLRYSPDGKLLAASLVTGGVQVFSASTGKEFGRDAPYGGDSFGIDFSPDGKRLVTTSRDGLLRLYAVENGQLQKIAQTDPAIVAGGQSKPRLAKFSPDGLSIAVGFNSMGGISIRRASDLGLISRVSGGSAELNKMTGDMSSNATALGWSSDGQYLYAGGWWGPGDYRIRRWSRGAAGTFSTASPKADVAIQDAGAINAIVPLARGGIAFSTSLPAWGVVSPGNELAWRAGNIVAGQGNYIFSQTSPPPLLVSDDGRRIGYNYHGNDPVVEFDTSRRLLGTPGTGLLPRKTEAPGLAIKLPLGPSSDEAVSLNGQPLAIPKSEFATNFAISPDGTRFAVSTLSSTWLFDRSGRLLWKEASGALSINISGNGRWLVANDLTGRIRWLRITDGREILALFPAPDHRRWVLWTPAGFYDASAGGDDLAGWHINRGADQSADFFPLARFRNNFLRPNMVSNALAEKTDASASTLQPAPEIEARLPPVVTILLPREGEAKEGEKISLQYSIRSPSGAPVSQIKVLFDGRPGSTHSSPAVRSSRQAELGEVTASLSLTPPTGTSIISVIAENASGASEPAILRLRAPSEDSARGAQRADSGKIPASEKPRLFALVVGVGDYAPPVSKLQFPAKDANDFARVMQENGRIYSETNLRVLDEKQATRTAILENLEWLKKSVGKRDVGILYLAGHGETDRNGNYYFLAQNADQKNLSTTGVAKADIIRTAASIRGKIIVFLDTCHAGAVNSARSDGLANELKSAENGAVVFAASSGEQASLESPGWKNGAFTKILVEGLAGQADILKRGHVTISGLDAYLSDRVPELTNQRQTPVVSKPGTIPDFPIAAQ